MGSAQSWLIAGSVVAALFVVDLVGVIADDRIRKIWWLLIPLFLISAGLFAKHFDEVKTVKTDLEKLTVKIENVKVLATGEAPEAKGVAVSAAAAKKAIEAFSTDEREKLIKTIGNTAADAKGDELSDKFLTKLGETVNEPPKGFSVSYTRLKAATTPS